MTTQQQFTIYHRPHSIRKLVTRFALCSVLCAALLLASGCGMAESLLKNSSGGTVAELWPDVPPIAGATKAAIEMPLAFRLMIQATFKGGIDYVSKAD